jgi:hypothetical protein
VPQLHVRPFHAPLSPHCTPHLQFGDGARAGCDVHSELGDARCKTRDGAVQLADLGSQGRLAGAELPQLSGGSRCSRLSSSDSLWGLEGERRRRRER